MTSSHSNENLKITLENWEPNLIVLPIPEQETNVSAPIEIFLRINNLTTRAYPFIENFLIPELLKEDRQVLPLQNSDSQASNHLYRGFSLSPQFPFLCPLTVELSWHGESLQLLMTIPSRYWTNDFHRWIFSQLQAGTYQLRFTYSSPQGEFSFLDASRGNSRTVENLQTEFLATDWLTLQLVEPVGNAVEVNGVCFEILVLEPIIMSPRYGEEKLVQWGVRISNRTSISYRFDLQQFRPEFLAPDGQWIQVGVNRNVTRLVKDSDIPLIKPRESVNFWMDVKLAWDNQEGETRDLVLQGEANYGGVWVTEISRGSYQVRLVYKNPFSEKEMRLFSTSEKRQVFQFWVGKIVTPFVELFFQ